MRLSSASSADSLDRSAAQEIFHFHIAEAGDADAALKNLLQSRHRLH